MKKMYLLLFITLFTLVNSFASANPIKWPRYLVHIHLTPIDRQETKFKARVKAEVLDETGSIQSYINYVTAPALSYLEIKRIEADMKLLHNENEVRAYAKEKYCHLMGKEMAFPKVIHLQDWKSLYGWSTGLPGKAVVAKIVAATNDEPITNGSTVGWDIDCGNIN